MATTYDFDDIILWYDDDNVYFEVTTLVKSYHGNKTICMEFDCQGKDGEEFYPLVFVEKKEIETMEELEKAIIHAIAYINAITGFQMSPVENSLLKNYTRSVWSRYQMD